MVKQSINMFKEPGKVLIEISNPSKETMKALDDLFGESIIDLANILVPIDNSKEDEAQKKELDNKVEAAVKQIDDGFVPVSDEEIPFGKPVEEKKPVDVKSMSEQEAKEWLKKFLGRLEKNPSMTFNAHRIFEAYAIARNRRDLLAGLENKSEKDLHELFVKKELDKKIAKLVGYEFKNEEYGWV